MSSHTIPLHNALYSLIIFTSSIYLTITIPNRLLVFFIIFTYYMKRNNKQQKQAISLLLLLYSLLVHNTQTTHSKYTSSVIVGWTSRQNVQSHALLLIFPWTPFEGFLHEQSNGANEPNNLKDDLLEFRMLIKFARKKKEKKNTGKKV